MPRVFPSALAAVAVLVVTGGAGIAAPVDFTGSFTVSAYTGSNNGLTIYTQNETSSLGSNGNLAFSLNAGQSTDAQNLFDIYTPEGSVQQDDTKKHQIKVDFAFTAPAPAFGGDATGKTVGHSELFGVYQYGTLTWNNGGIFDIAYPGGGDGDLRVALTGGAFNAGFFGLDSGPCDGLIVTANFTNVKDPTPVSEPASIALFGVGLLGLGMIATHRRGRPGSIA